MPGWSRRHQTWKPNLHAISLSLDVDIWGQDCEAVTNWCAADSCRPWERRCLAVSLTPAISAALHAVLVTPHTAAAAAGGDPSVAARERMSATPPPGTPDADMGAGTASVTADHRGLTDATVSHAAAVSMDQSRSPKVQV